MSNLLSKGTTNAKTVKNSIPTYILYLAPYRTALSSYNVCPMASAGCIQSCLFTAGFAGVYHSVNEARIRKTKFFLENQLGFLNQLLLELTKINSKGIKTAIRLNGTSDLDLIKLIKVKLKTDILTFLSFMTIPKFLTRLKHTREQIIP